MMSNPQEPEGTARSATAGTRTAIRENAGNNGESENIEKSNNMKLIVVIAGIVLSILIPLVRQSPIYKGHVALEKTRNVTGLPPTWEELVIETKEKFQVGFVDLLLPKMFIESLRGFEMSFLEDDSFYSFEYFLQQTGNKDLTATDWSKPLRTTHLQRLGTTANRTISYMHPVSNPMAPNWAQAIKKQRLERYHRNYFLIQTQTIVSDVPMADCFIVEERLLVETKGNKIRVSGYFYIDFIKPTMFRSIIEKQTSTEFYEYMENYKSFLWLVSTGNPHEWKPTMNSVGTSTNNDNDSSLSSYNIRKPKGILTLFGPIGRQLGRFKRFVGNLTKILRKQPKNAS